jgi:hypothetical protein
MVLPFNPVNVERIRSRATALARLGHGATAQHTWTKGMEETNIDGGSG